jgi:hypothetical protein
MDIREALSQLDTLNDDHWTSEGAPKIDAVKELLGGPVTRQDIINAAPHFSRENPIVEEEKSNAEEGQGVFEGRQEEVIIDSALLDEFAQKEPMDPNLFLGFLMTVPTAGLQELLEILQEQQSGVEANRKKLDEMDLRIRHAMLHTKARINREIPDVSDREANMAYIKRQQELRAAKHAATTQLLKGVDLKSLDPRAPIDRAMARKTQRGVHRPNFGVKG